MPKKKKILWHLPYAVVGGVETLYATVLKYIDKDNYSHVVTCHQDISDWVTRNYRGFAQVRTFSGIEDLSRTLDSVKPDIIMGTHGATLYAALNQCQKNYPVIEVVHGSHIWCEHNVYMPKDWTKQIVCVSSSAQRVYQKASNSPLPSTVIINGVDTEVFNPKKAIARQSKVVAYFGRFLECDKHITKVIQAFKCLGDHYARLHLIGGTPEETVRLKHFSRSLKMTSLVKFFGHTDNPELHYKNVDVATVRSEAEGYCNSAAEALATGTPLVCFNFGGIIEHVEPGVIAVANTQSEYAVLLRDVHRDYEKRKIMRRRGLEFIHTLGNAKIMAQKYEDVFSNMLAGKTIQTTTSDNLIGQPSKNEILQKTTTKVVTGRKTRDVKIPHVGSVTISNLRPVVGVFDPNWHGIATATTGCTDIHVHWNRNPQIMLRNILRHNPKDVLFSGMCVGFDHTIRGLKRQRPDIRIFSYYHGGISHYSFGSGLFGEGERQAFNKILRLQKEGLISRIAVSAPGLAEVLRVNGFNVQFCGNIREHEELPPRNTLPGFHIGNWNRHHDHKHTTIGVGAGQLIKGAVVHCLQGHPIIPGLDMSRIKAYPQMPQERLFENYRSMTVNLQMSFIETFNISVMEMFAAGRPVLISPSNRVLIEGDNLLEEYLLKDPTNPVELSKLIEKAAKNDEALIEAQFNQLDKLNKESKERWARFFL